MTYQSPGVYIEEVPSGPQPIAAASTSVVAVIGNLRKGPVLKPTRITGWSDFVRTFGSAHAGGYTAEAVYGFFENGGPAAWVVRVDPSVGAAWEIRDSTPALSFEARATSPGAWANGVSLTVAPDLTGGAGTMAHATVSGAVAVPAGTIDVPVASTGGLAAGDAVVLLNAAGATATGTVNTVGSTSLNVTSDAIIALGAGDVVAARTAAAPVTITLAAGSGIKPGDLLVAQNADGSRASGLVATVVRSGPRLIVTLTAPLGSALNGAGLARRFARYKGTIPGGATTFSLGQVTWQLDSALVPVNADGQMSNARATVSSGAVAAFSGTSFAMPGGQTAPSGPVEVDAQVRVAVYSEAIDFAPASVAAVLSRFNFLPVGTAIRLTNGTQTTTVTRTGATTGTGVGDALPLAVPQSFTSATFVLPANATSGVVMRCAVAPRVGDFVDFAGTQLRITSAENPTGTVYVLDFAANYPAVPAAASYPLLAFSPTSFFPMRFTLGVAENGAVVETFPGLALDPTHPQYYARAGIVNGTSAYVTVSPRAGTAPAISLTSMPALATATQAGVDRPPAGIDYKNGLTALETEPEPAMVICPDTVTFTDPLLQADLVGAVVNHCEEFRRFAVVDAPDLASDTDLLDWRNTTLASTYAALYAPHVMVVNIDPDSTERFRKVPPSGFVAGVFARTDRERGVYKAPGNERVAGIVGLSQSYTQRRQDLLNPGSVNLIRAFPGRGTRIWGARNATDDVTWRYVNVRRLFNFVERSVENGTQWVVFEPNTASTWIRIKVSLENFLDQLWRSGALAGTTPEQAYRVRVGLGETMTETDIDLGLVVTEVAIAPAKPAEFVVFRFSHKRLSE